MSSWYNGGKLAKKIEDMADALTNEQDGCVEGQTVFKTITTMFRTE